MSNHLRGVNCYIRRNVADLGGGMSASCTLGPVVHWHG